MQTPNPTVAQIGELDRTGERGVWIPTTWFLHPKLQFENGKPHIKAMLLLADIVYWYRPRHARGEAGGMQQKFAADKLQKTYESWGREFNLSRDEARYACYFLRDAGFITIESRTLTTKGGLRLNNVTFFEPVAQAIQELSQAPELFQNETDAMQDGTAPNQSGTAIKQNGTGSVFETPDLCDSNANPLGFKCQRGEDRNTDITESTPIDYDREYTRNTQREPAQSSETPPKGVNVSACRPPWADLNGDCEEEEEWDEKQWIDEQWDDDG